MTEVKYPEIKNSELSAAYTFNKAIDLIRSDQDVRPLLISQEAQLMSLCAIERSQESLYSKVAKILRPNIVLTHELELTKMGIAIAEANENSLTDAVTGVYSRKFLDQYLFQELSQLSRKKKGNEPLEGVAVLFVDVDLLKYVNDTYGHLAGDRVLRLVASSLQIRSEDIVARYGGDEIAIVMKTDDPKKLRERYFGPDDDTAYKGTFAGSELLHINQLIQEGIEDIAKEFPGFKWEPAIYEGQVTYITAGMSYLGEGVLKDSRSAAVKNFMDKILKDADAEMYQNKKRRRTERTKSS